MSQKKIILTKMAQVIPMKRKGKSLRKRKKIILTEKANEFCLSKRGMTSQEKLLLQN